MQKCKRKEISPEQSKEDNNREFAKKEKKKSTKEYPGFNSSKDGYAKIVCIQKYLRERELELRKRRESERVNGTKRKKKRKKVWKFHISTNLPSIETTDESKEKRMGSM